MPDCSDLSGEANRTGLILSTTNRTSLTTVTVSCANSDYQLVGSSHLTCNSSGNWSSLLPECRSTGSEGLTEREIITIACAAGVVFVLVTCLVVILSCYGWKKRVKRRKRLERLAQTMERISLRDPLDELVRRESRRSLVSYQNEALSNGNAGGDMITNKRKMYKIWNHTRERRTFTFADDLEELKYKGREKLGISGALKVVLEEDGTEIDNDEILRACAGQIMLIVPVNETWRDPEVLLTVSNLAPYSTRF